MDDKITTDNDITKEEDLGTLSQFMAEPTVRLKQFKDKVHFKLDLLSSDEGVLTEVTVEIPEPFKRSIFCQSIIAYFYSDDFKLHADLTKNNYLGLFNRFFLYLTIRDKNVDNEETWANLLALPNADLPHNVIQQFLSHLSEYSDAGATSLRCYQLQLLHIATWVTEHNTDTLEPNFEGGNELLPYITKKNNPEIKTDYRKPRLALSQLFTIDHKTGEEIQCPYSDSQLITNLRWFAKWYLNTMRERRLFFRKIKWDEDRTIYEVLKDRINDGTWSLEELPVCAMYGRKTKIKGKEIPLVAFVEASAMYAKVYEALLPSEDEAEKMSRGDIPPELQTKLIWAESEGYSNNQFTFLGNHLSENESTIKSVLENLKSSLIYNSSYSPTTNKHKGVKVPIRLCSGPTSHEGIRAIKIPRFSLAEMIKHSKSESLVMSWLLASECIQSSNQKRLKLSDLKKLNRERALQVVDVDTCIDIEVNTIKIYHHKGRSKDKNKQRTGRDFDTIEYQKGDPLFTTYSNWYEDKKEAIPYLNRYKESWFYGNIKAFSGGNSLMSIIFLMAKESLLRSAFEKSEQDLKFHSETNGQGSFQWIFSKFINNYVYYMNNAGKYSLVTLNVDAIRQSRIIFEEGENSSDKKNAKRTAHSEQQVQAYRENGEAKERIQNGLKGHVQIANKMYEEAISILDSCHLMNIEEVEKELHAPKGITTDDVIKLINEFAANPKKYDVTIFGGIIEKSSPESGIKIIKDDKSAWMMYCYIKHMESELDQIKENHDEQQVVEHIVEHAQWSILFERFPIEMQQQAKILAEQYVIPYPPLF